jgi:uncharacterized protein YjaZ
MHTEWIATNDYYRQIIAAPDMATREQRYRELLLQPWQDLMAMVAPPAPDTPDDGLAGARAWGWLLPADLTSEPAALHKLAAADAWTVAAKALATGAARFAPYADRVPLEHVTGWLVLADPARTDPVMRGYTGAVDWTQPRFIIQFDTPNDDNLPRLPGMVVHELHHLIRLQLFPWDMLNTSVADYIIHEGLAESFAAALYGEQVVGHYVTEFDASQLDTARALVGEGLDKTGFQLIRSYIFGDHWAEKLGLPRVGVPTYGGYAIGYRVVQAFLARTGTTIEAATFLPAAEIIRGSAYFA